MQVGDIVEGLPDADWCYVKTKAGTRWAVAEIFLDNYIGGPNLRILVIPATQEALRDYILKKDRKRSFIVDPNHFEVVGHIDITFTNEDYLNRAKELQTLKKVEDYFA